jgi:hypothetical protein
MLFPAWLAGLFGTFIVLVAFKYNKGLSARGGFQPNFAIIDTVSKPV